MTPASLDELLKEWEKQAKENIANNNYFPIPRFDEFANRLKYREERILSLVAVVRKQREALSYFKGAKRCEIAIWDEHGSLSVGQPNPEFFLNTLTEAERILKG